MCKHSLSFYEPNGQWFCLICGATEQREDLMRDILARRRLPSLEQLRQKNLDDDIDYDDLGEIGFPF